jgi:hypothetical protein
MVIFMSAGNNVRPIINCQIVAIPSAEALIPNANGARVPSDAQTDDVNQPSRIDPFTPRSTATEF